MTNMSKILSWQPIQNGYPEPQEEVLVAAFDGVIEMGFYNIIHNEFITLERHLRIDQVTHWMPLPNHPNSPPELALRKAEELLSLPKAILVPEKVQEADQELVKHLEPMHPFFVRWRYYMKDFLPTP